MALSLGIIRHDGMYTVVSTGKWYWSSEENDLGLEMRESEQERERKVQRKKQDDKDRDI